MTSTDEQVRRLQRGLQELAYPAASRASSKAARAGGKVLERAIKAAAPVGKARTVKGQKIQGGTLRNAVGSRFIKGRANGVTTLKAGLNVGKGRPTAKGSKERKGNYAPHAHFPALGTRPRWRGVKYGYIRKRGKQSEYNPDRDTLTGKKVAYTGLVTANDFVARASQGAAPAASQAVITTLDAEIRREVAKASPGGAR